MRAIRRILLSFGLVVGSLSAAPASASILLDVGGPNKTYAIARGAAAGVSFTLDETRSNVTITAPVLCLGCSGGIWLHKDSVGPSASFAGSLGGEAFSSSTPTPFFSFSSLDAGLYFFIVSVNADSAASALWSGSSAPVITSDGAFRGLDIAALSTRPFVPLSSFSPIFGQGLNFTVEGDSFATPVPEPSTWVTLIVGFGLLGAHRRRAKRSLRPAV